VANPRSSDVILEQYRRGESSKLNYYRLAATADRRSFSDLLRLIEMYVPRGRILDVGCNIGTFVETARKRGWDATGVDVNTEALEYGRRELGLNLLTPQELESTPARHFDVLHSSDTLEHFLEPVAMLREFAVKLRPGGLLFISTPNYDSTLCKLFQLKPTEHLFLFNARSLTYLFHRLDLDLLNVVFFDRYRNISAMFESTTFDRFQRVKALFKALHRVAPELILRLKGHENIVAIARVPAHQER
jgi:2-polyprenyl-3-methyl-5-hydroxy-6-metoxy-1,4-benzoquinol methylase